MTPWVFRLIVANVVVYVLTATAPALKVMLAFVPQLALVQPWTFVTYMFVHADFWHITFNMLGLFFFGPQLEARLGERHFLGLYFASGLTGALLSIPAGHPIVGASAATFGVFLGFARYWPRVRILIWGIVPIEARWMVLIMTALAIFGGAGLGQPGIAHLAHLGGFLGGFIYLHILERRRFRARAAPFPSLPRTRGDGADLERWKRINRDGMHPVNREEFDRVLAKLETRGLASLTPDERAFLDRFS